VLNQLSIWLILQLTLEFKTIAKFPELYPTDWVNGLTVIYAGAPACVTVIVPDTPPPLTVTWPVRGLVLVLALVVNPNPPLPVPLEGYADNQLSQLTFQLVLELTEILAGLPPL
jgi:hypothetical protein